MTPEEAIHELKIIKKEIATYEVNTPRCKVMRWSTVTYHTFETAYEALEKQIPKKPKRAVYNSTPDYIYCSCPVCNIVVARIKKDEYGELWEKHIPNYCDYCGQALNWSEV